MEQFEKGIIKDFWDWIEKNKDYVGVQYLTKNEFWLYIAFDSDTLSSFTEEWQGLCEERGCPCAIQMNTLCIKIKDIMGGYGFTMTDLWENRPEGIEDKLGDCLY